MLPSSFTRCNRRKKMLDNKKRGCAVFTSHRRIFFFLYDVTLPVLHNFVYLDKLSLIEYYLNCQIVNSIWYTSNNIYNFDLANIGYVKRGIIWASKCTSNVGSFELANIWVRQTWGHLELANIWVCQTWDHFELANIWVRQTHIC